LPDGFELIPDSRGVARQTNVVIREGAIQLSDRIIFGLIAVAVMCPASKGQVVPNGYHLTFGATEKLLINDWWGRASDFPAIAAKDPVPSITLDFNDWMKDV